MSKRHQGKAADARYDSNRDAKTGHFRPGHKLHTGVDHALHKQFQRIRNMWLEVSNETDVRKVWDELIGMCLSDKTPPDVKLKSIVYALDRLWGRPQENIQLDVTGAPADTLVDLTKDELSILQRVVGRSQNSKELVGEPSLGEIIDATPELPSARPPGAPSTLSVD